MAKSEATKTRSKKNPGKPAAKKPGSVVVKVGSKPRSNVKSKAGKKGAASTKTPGAVHLDLKQPMEKKMAQKNTASIEKMAQGGVEASREYSEACMKSGTILMKGFEDIMSAVVSLTQETAEKQARLMKEAMSSKTLNEFTDIQNKIAQESFDDFMSGATKITELSVKVLTESADPVNQQMTSAVQKATESLAA